MTNTCNAIQDESLTPTSFRTSLGARAGDFIEKRWQDHKTYCEAIAKLKSDRAAKRNEILDSQFNWGAVDTSKALAFLDKVEGRSCGD